MNETRAKMTVDDGDFNASLDRMKQRVESYYREMIVHARSYTTSSKETLKSLEDQIKAIERISEAEFKASRSRLEKQFSSDKISQEQYSSGRKEAFDDWQDEHKIASLLRELIDATRENAEKEIRENRKGVEEQIKQSKTVNELLADDIYKTDDPEKVLKETLQREMLGTLGESEESERSKFQEFISEKGGVANRIIGMGASKNELYAAAAVVAAIPLVGQGLSMIMSKLLGAAENLESSRETLHGTIGSDALDLTSYGKMHRSGYTIADQLQARSDYARANFRQGYENELYAERGLGLRRGELSALATTQRGTGYQAASTANVLAGTISSLTRDGAQTRAYLGEYLSILVDVNKEQLSTIGRVDSGVNTKVIASLTQLGKEYENPEFLRGVVMSVHQGLKQSQTPQVEAMQYEVLSRVSPGASLWEMRRMMEDPFSAAEGKYLPAMLQSIIDISGSENDAFFNMQSIFGVSGKVAEDLVKMAGDLKTPEQIKAVVGYDLQAEGDEGTGLLKRSTARTDSFFQTNGEKLIKFVDTSVNMFEKLTKAMGRGRKSDPMYVIIVDKETGEFKVTNEHKLDHAGMSTLVKGINQGLDQNRETLELLKRKLEQKENQVKGG